MNLPLPRILVLDDDEAVTSTLSLLLSRDFAVVTATEGADALEQLQKIPFDVIFCDLSMPTMSGVEVFDRARKLNPEVSEKFIFMTGGACSDEAAAFLKRIPNRQLQKPFTYQSIRAMIEELLAEPAAVRSTTE